MSDIPKQELLDAYRALRAPTDLADVALAEAARHAHQRTVRRPVWALAATVMLMGPAVLWLSSTQPGAVSGESTTMSFKPTRVSVTQPARPVLANAPSVSLAVPVSVTTPTRPRPPMNTISPQGEPTSQLIQEISDAPI